MPAGKLGAVSPLLTFFAAVRLMQIQRLPAVLASVHPTLCTWPQFPVGVPKVMVAEMPERHFPG